MSRNFEQYLISKQKNPNKPLKIKLVCLFLNSKRFKKYSVIHVSEISVDFQIPETYF